jgi:hypothetical protein
MNPIAEYRLLAGRQKFVSLLCSKIHLVGKILDN